MYGICFPPTPLLPLILSRIRRGSSVANANCLDTSRPASYLQPIRALAEPLKDRLRESRRLPVDAQQSCAEFLCRTRVGRLEEPQERIDPDRFQDCTQNNLNVQWRHEPKRIESRKRRTK